MERRLPSPEPHLLAAPPRRPPLGLLLASVCLVPRGVSVTCWAERLVPVSPGARRPHAPSGACLPCCCCFRHFPLHVSVREVSFDDSSRVLFRSFARFRLFVFAGRPLCACAPRRPGSAVSSISAKFLRLCWRHSRYVAVTPRCLGLRAPNVC